MTNIKDYGVVKRFNTTVSKTAISMGSNPSAVTSRLLGDGSGQQPGL